jgi:transcriptional regulator with XRE-family HTH domain
MREERGLRAKYVAERSGYTPSHLSKIESKADISVEEFGRVMRAMGLKPGDFLENSAGEVAPYLPILDELRQLGPATMPHVRALLEQVVAIVRTA